MKSLTMRYAADSLRRHVVTVCWSIVTIIGVGSAIGLSLMYRTMAPLQRGTSHRFWNIATDLALSADVSSEWGGDAWFMDESWAGYDEINLHGSRTYCVPISEVTTDFAAVVAAFEQARAAGSKLKSVDDYVSWRDDPKSKHDALSLVRHIQQQRRRRIWERRPEGLTWPIENEQLFQRRWRHADWYWASAVFEWLLLTGLTLFVVWPGIRQQSVFHWAAHIACAPLLFYAPLYLGYATYSLTSAGPSGGILYPWMLLFCRGGSTTHVDELILKYLPPILEPLSSPIGLPMALTGYGMTGPTSAIINGAVSAAVLLTCHFGLRWWWNRNHQLPD